MPLTRKTYRQIAKDILTQITGGETTEEHKYVTGKTLYKLSNTPITEIKEVKGVSKGAPKSFAKDVDYRLTADSVEWLAGGEHPDEDTDFASNYTFARSPGISDVNPGSVVRTIVEAISREIEYLYAQMEHAYLSGFLDTATGEALDLVVSILGVKRKPPQPSSGHVIFGRDTEPETLSVVGERILYEGGSLEYDLKKPLVKEITKIEGEHEGSPKPVTFGKDVDYSLVEKLLRDGRKVQKVNWLPDGRKPKEGTIFSVDYTCYREVPIPKGTVVATFSPRPEESRSFTTTEETKLKLTSEGRWEAEVPVICNVPGQRGNVLAGIITVMPRPVPGVEYVINKGDITNGVEAESDSELRERAKHALEFAGKATISSIESAIRAVEGVSSLYIEDRPEEVAGIVKVIVDGGDEHEILRAIEETRAAGIKVEFSKPRPVYIDVSLTLTLPKEIWEREKERERTESEAGKLVASYISSLGIGDDVLYSKIIEAALSARGVLDVTDVIIMAYRKEEVFESEFENIEIDSEERAKPRNIQVESEEKE